MPASPSRRRPEQRAAHRAARGRRRRRPPRARARDTIVVEDDYDGELRFDRQPASAVPGLDPEHVVYAGTASKVLMARAAGRSLGLMALGPFWHTPPGRGTDGLVIGYAASPEHAYGQALGVLGDVLGGA